MFKCKKLGLGLVLLVVMNGFSLGNSKKLDLNDFSFGGPLRYNANQNAIEKVLGKPIRNLVPKLVEYVDDNRHIGIVYRNKKAVSIAILRSTQFSTRRGIKIGDPYEEVIQTYGKPDMEAPNKEYLSYEIPNQQDRNANLLLEFSFANGAVQTMIVEDYRALVHKE